MATGAPVAGGGEAGGWGTVVGEVEGGAGAVVGVAGGALPEPFHTGGPGTL